MIQNHCQFRKGGVRYPLTIVGWRVTTSAGYCRCHHRRVGKCATSTEPGEQQKKVPSVGFRLWQWQHRYFLRLDLILGLGLGLGLGCACRGILDAYNKFIRKFFFSRRKKKRRKKILDFSLANLVGYSSLEWVFDCEISAWRVRGRCWSESHLIGNRRWIYSILQWLRRRQRRLSSI